MGKRSELEFFPGEAISISEKRNPHGGEDRNVRNEDFEKIEFHTYK